MRYASLLLIFILQLFGSVNGGDLSAEEPAKPNFVLCMADDQGWGDVGFRDHPVLKTPVLDELAATCLRFDRFYAAAPVCSPTRGSVMTGRHPNRFGCFSWGHTLRPQEITIAEALKTAGYATGHFGKWHLGDMNADSPISPGNSGFDEWLSAPNFYENDSLMSHNGKVVQAKGESSQLAVDAAIEFIRSCQDRKQPFLAVVWFGSPHAPHIATEEFRKQYDDQPKALQHFYGEIAGIDSAVGNLRKALRKLRVADNTLLWYTSDNGALPVGSAGGLSGNKGNLSEGGIRVPAMIEWPARIKQPQVVNTPAGSVDIYPTLLELAGVKMKDQPVLDGISLASAIDGKYESRKKPLGFWVHPTPGISRRSTEILKNLQAEQAGGASSAGAVADPSKITRQYPEDEFPGSAAWIDGNYKILRAAKGDDGVALFDLSRDAGEKHDIAASDPDRAAMMTAELTAWQKSVAQSLNGKDYRASAD